MGLIIGLNRNDRNGEKMKHKKLTLLSALIIGTFVLSTFGNAALFAETSGAIVTNFTIKVETNVGNRRRQSFAYYLVKALAPLGINVEVVGKQWGSFVGDLLGDVGSKKYDIAIVGFSGGSVIAPDFVSLYTSGGFFGANTYQLGTKAWQDWLPQDPGNTANLTQAKVDKLLNDMKKNLDLPSRKDQTLLFTKWFMQNLLYDYPLLAPTGVVSIWKGLNGYDPLLGTHSSVYKGAYWDSTTPAGRKNNKSTIAVRLATMPGVWDPLRISDTETGFVLNGLFPTLLMDGAAYEPHPWLAKQFNVSTWFNAPVGPNNTAVDVPYGKIDFWINQNQKWINSTTGAVYGNVTLDDVAFTLDMYTKAHPYIIINGQDLYQYLDHYTMNKTTGRITLYISSPTLEDVRNFGGIQIVPSKLLGGDLVFANKTKIRVFENTTGYWGNYDPFATETWKNFAANPIQSGPYYIDFTNTNFFKAGQYIYKRANSMFTFPNEWDAPNGQFDLRKGVNQTAYYFAYNATSALPHQKPTELKIKTFYSPIVDDANVELVLFKSGEVDLTSPTAFGAEEVLSQKNDPRFLVFQIPTLSTADLLMFNLLNPNLKNYYVRRALASAIDKKALQAIVDNLRAPQDSPVKIFFEPSGYYTNQYKIPFDLNEAKVLMQKAGYKIATTTNGGGGGVIPSQILPGSFVGNPVLALIASFAVITTAVVMKKKRRV